MHRAGVITLLASSIIGQTSQAFPIRSTLAHTQAKPNNIAADQNTWLPKPNARTAETLHDRSLRSAHGALRMSSAEPLIPSDAAKNLVQTERGDLILKPLPNKGAQQSIIFLPGAETKPEQYLPLAKSLQKHSPESLWIGIAKYEMPVADIELFDTTMPIVALEGYTNPVAISQEVKTVTHAMRQSGMSVDKPFLVGHSLGGAFLHHVVLQNADEYAGIIHLSSFLPRRLTAEHPARNLPTLTISGDLDGLVSIMRIAEAYYHNVEHAEAEARDPLSNPVVVIEGANHASFFKGKPPPFVAAHDFSPEVAHDIAKDQIAETISNFITTQTATDNTLARTALTSEVAASGVLLKPLIDALKLEGSYHLKYPCSMADKADPEHCWVGSPWVEEVTPFITGADQDGLNITTRDEFNPSWIVNLPFLTEPGKPTFHHPKVTPPDQKQGDEAPITIDTVSEAVYNPLDQRFDAGLTPNTAQRIRAKFPSRQAVQAAAGNSIAFDSDNNRNLASQINQKAIDWAVANASPKARLRYEIRGIPLVSGRDIDVHTGPDWIWSDFEKRLSWDETGQPRYVIDAAVMRAPMESPIRKIPFLPAALSEGVDKLIGGKHFATLISPAEAMRHVYEDSLRPLPKAGASSQRATSSDALAKTLAHNTTQDNSANNTLH